MFTVYESVTFCHADIICPGDDDAYRYQRIDELENLNTFLTNIKLSI